jgi:hypothetical protein
MTIALTSLAIGTVALVTLAAIVAEYRLANG